MNQAIRHTLTRAARRTVTGLVASALTSAAAAGPPDAPAADAVGNAARAGELTQREAFRPSLHGFKFRNAFTGSPIPPRYRALVSSLGLDGAIDTGATYGLCGGMSAAAADFYLAGVEVPGRTSVPGDGEALFTYLSDRQVDSLGPGFLLALKYAEWMAYDDHRPGQAPRSGRTDIAAETAKQLPAIYDKLDNHDLVILGLVLVKVGGGALWENHQVLAYGYDRTDDEVRIHLYDSNFPGDDGVALVIRAWEPGQEDRAVRCELVTSKRKPRPVRGLFEMPYTPRTPPESVSR